MPVFGIGLHVLLAVFFAIHAVRSRQELYWLFILFMFPLLGSIVYGLAIWLPEFRHSRPARALGKGLRQAIDPKRQLREALTDFDEADTVERQLRLADALLAEGRASEAMVHYQGALRGPFKNDPDIQVKLAKALLESGHPDQARVMLDTLIRDQPEYKSALGHLTYARALAECGEQAPAREEFEVLVGYHPGLEAPARYVDYLRRWGEREHAEQVRNQALSRAQRLPRHSRELERQWLQQLQRSAD